MCAGIRRQSRAGNAAVSRHRLVQQPPCRKWQRTNAARRIMMTSTDAQPGQALSGLRFRLTLPTWEG